MSWPYPETRAIIVSHVRSGSTFLCYGLDSHPEIGCERSEVLGKNSAWMRTVKDSDAIVSLWLSRPGYRVCAIKATYGQANLLSDDTLNDVAFIQVRRPLLYCYVSQAINAAYRSNALHGPHRTDEAAPFAIRLGEPLEIDTQDALNTCRQWIAGEAAFVKRIEQLGCRLLVLSYIEITGGETNAKRIGDNAAGKLCAYLNVYRQTLPSLIRRSNPESLETLVSNCAEVKLAFIDAGLGEHIE